jgi:adenine-specific DNA-methyltransferase
MAKTRKSGKKPIEQYDHRGKRRVNNPPVGLVTPETDRDSGKKNYAYDPHLDPQLQFDGQRSQIEKTINRGLSAETLEQAKAALAELKKRQDPYLNWAGKAEHTSFEVPTLSLHVHERVDPRTIIEAVRKTNGQAAQLSLFASAEENPPIRQAIEFYKHKHNWTNRLIAGDSLLVMNSLLEKEGMAGKVQMIYIDPPYGIKYGSNFQPFVNRRDVKDGKDEDLTAEPEQIRAFRDTWELGIHSYLTYLRDRLLLSRELLTESGSILVQISDENVHHVRELMDEVLKAENFVSLIIFTKTGGFQSRLLDSLFDMILVYARNKAKCKFHKLYQPKVASRSGLSNYPYVELRSGERRNITQEESDDPSRIPSGSRLFGVHALTSAGNASEPQPFEYGGKTWLPKSGEHWKAKYPEGMKRLADRGRIEATESRVGYVRYLDDFPVLPVTNTWMDTRGEMHIRYVVETSEKVIQRCLLMTTDPGDLVFDPTCGSGTTAYVAERWGRRWITCDTSRVALTLARQRLMTAVFDYYELAHPEEGVGSGFNYKTVPHITLKSIANNEPPATETLYDQPFVDRKKVRVSGPFTVEAVPAPAVKSLEEIQIVPQASPPASSSRGKAGNAGEDARATGADASIARSGETLRQAEWRDELLRTGIRGKRGQFILFSRVEALAGTRWLHADAETKPNDRGADSVKEQGITYGQPLRTVISFGPEHAPLEQRQVALAIEEAQTLVPKPKIIIFAAFQFDPEAAKDIDETDWPGVTLLKAQMNADLQTEDLKKKRASNESFWLIGQPDIALEQIRKGKDKGKYTLTVLGFDYYNTKSGTIESGGSQNIAMWMLDTDYDGRSLLPRQVFFPMAADKEGWSRLARTLRSEIDEELIEAYRGTVSLPFDVGENRRIAVKIVDDRGIESLRILQVE